MKDTIQAIGNNTKENYRVIYSIDEEAMQVLVYTIAHRGEVYDL